MKPAHELIAAIHGVHDYDRYEALYAALWKEVELYVDDDLVVPDGAPQESFLRRFKHPGAIDLPANIDGDAFKLLEYTVHAINTDMREYGYILRVFWPDQRFTDTGDRFQLAPVTIKKTLFEPDKRVRETLYYDPKGVPTPWWSKDGFITFQVKVWRNHRYFFKK